MRLYSVYYTSVDSSTRFGCWHPSSVARTTVITASGTGQLGLLPSALVVELELTREDGSRPSRPVPEAVITVVRATDNGYQHPKRVELSAEVQGKSLARGPKLLSIKNYVIEIMTWKFIYTYRERRKTGPAHNRCWNWSPFTSKHTWMLFSKFWNSFPKVSTLTAWISWRIASLSCSIVRGVFLYTLPFSRPQRKKSAGVRSASPCF